MARKIRTAFIAVVLALIVFLASVYHHFLLANPVLFISSADVVLSPPHPLQQSNPHNVIRVVEGHDAISTVSIMLPAWEILVILSPETRQPIPDYDTRNYICLFPNNLPSPAKPSGILRFPDRATFKCDFPDRLRHRLPFHQPILTKLPKNPPARLSLFPVIPRWNFLVYDSLSTENDVILFAKGLNNRQGVNRAPKELRCLFGDSAVHGVRTSVTTSLQEVFRCQRPELNVISDGVNPIKISLEISGQQIVVPSIAYYSPPPKTESEERKSILCACTMIYNAAKFLKEWVVYHSGIGIKKFILYDNGSDDDLERIVSELVEQGYDVSTLFWLWPKTQEAGFSHCAINAKDSCTWMAYIDVDEFVYSPSWLNLSNPSDQMWTFLLPKSKTLMVNNEIDVVGQVMINCYEFGPSNQKSHPVNGVIQGYNCRRIDENRHKSIVLLEAIDESLVNSIHHFQLKEGYAVKKVVSEKAVVNHYKYQAWPEFKTKFRRRVSAYVVDWMQEVNPRSNDRTPGLGYVPVEPQGWPEKFCEVYDDRLKDLTQRWFGIESPSGFHTAWQI